jgi:hypothetical protein
VRSKSYACLSPRPSRTLVCIGHAHAWRHIVFRHRCTHTRAHITKHQAENHWISRAGVGKPVVKRLVFGHGDSCRARGEKKQCNNLPHDGTAIAITAWGRSSVAPYFEPSGVLRAPNPSRNCTTIPVVGGWFTVFHSGRHAHLVSHCAGVVQRFRWSKGTSALTSALSETISCL